MSKLTIACDIDGILAQFVPIFVDAVNQVFPEKKVPSDFQPNDWMFSEIVTPEEFKPVWEVTRNKKAIWSEIKPYQDNVFVLKKFLASKHKEYDLYYLTARFETGGESAFSQTSKWLIAHGLLQYNTSLVVVENANSKIPVAKALGVWAMIDDHLPTTVSLAAELGPGVCLYDRPWNKKDRPENLKAVPDLASFLEHIEDMKAILA